MTRFAVGPRRRSPREPCHDQPPFADSPPFSFAADGQPAGYSVDLCKRVAAGIERSAGVQGLAVKWVPLSAANRFDQVANGSVDDLRRIARLPTKIRLTVANGAAGNARDWLGSVDNWRQINGHVIELDAAPEQKIAVLRRATEKGAPVEDIDVVPPTLDELYAHFLNTQEAVR